MERGHFGASGGGCAGGGEGLWPLCWTPDWGLPGGALGGGVLGGVLLGAPGVISAAGGADPLLNRSGCSAGSGCGTLTTGGATGVPGVAGAVALVSGAVPGAWSS